MPESLPHTIALVAGAEDAGERLDRFLHRKRPEISRSRFKDLIKEGRVAIGQHKVLEPNRRIETGMEVTAAVPPPADPVPGPESIALDVIFEDDHLIVVDKPAGMVVHPAAGNWSGTLVNALIAHCGASLSGIGGVRRPGIVHRLDKDTSGLLVAAKTDKSHSGLAGQFAAHGRDGRLHRAYLALAWGQLPRRRDTIEGALGRSVTNRMKMAVVTSGGKAAITRYEVLETLNAGGGEPAVSIVRCVLETGRTHQIRVHLAHIGHPILGDGVYGPGFAASAKKLPDRARAALGRQALHAAVLGFRHPETGEDLLFESALPGDMIAAIDACR